MVGPRPADGRGSFVYTPGPVLHAMLVFFRLCILKFEATYTMIRKDYLVHGADLDYQCVECIRRREVESPSRPGLGAPILLKCHWDLFQSPLASGVYSDAPQKTTLTPRRMALVPTMRSPQKVVSLQYSGRLSVWFGPSLPVHDYSRSANALERNLDKTRAYYRTRITGPPMLPITSCHHPRWKYGFARGLTVKQ